MNPDLFLLARSKRLFVIGLLLAPLLTVSYVFFSLSLWDFKTDWHAIEFTY